MNRSKAQPKSKLPVWIWILLAAFIVVMILAAFLRSSAGEQAVYPAEVSVVEAAEKRAAGAFMLDVREPEEWEAGHIPDATLIPLNELSSRIDELPRDQEIVVVCRSGNRSAVGRDVLREAGFEQVSSMAGGMNEWQAQGFPTE